MTYRDELEADRARIDALERQNAELQAQIDAKAKPPAPKKDPPPRVRSRALLVVAFWAAAMLAIAGSAIAPVSMRLTAPVLCSKESNRSVVVLHVRGTSRGGTSYSGDLWCVFPDKHHYPERVSTFAVMGVLFAGWLVIAMSIAGALYAIGRSPETAE